jgi:hypothetical protein
MAATQEAKKDPVIVVLQLTGGNDYLNTVIPYNNPLYRDNRKAVGIPDNQIMHLDKASFLGSSPSAHVTRLPRVVADTHEFFPGRSHIRGRTPPPGVTRVSFHPTVVQP